MARERVNLRDSDGEKVACLLCLEPTDQMLLDRLLWCDDCRRQARNRAAWWGWVGGILFASSAALYIWFVIRPTDLVIGGWAGTLVAAVWIGQKVARELAYGAMRFILGRPTRAMPATGTPGDGLVE